MIRHRFDKYQITKDIEERVLTNFSANYLESMLESIEADKKEVIENLNLLAVAVKAQVEVAKNTSFITKVFIERRINHHNKVMFEVWWASIPEHLMELKSCMAFPYSLERYIYPNGAREEFNGQQRREALKAAEALAAELGGVEIVKLRF